MKQEEKNAIKFSQKVRKEDESMSNTDFIPCSGVSAISIIGGRFSGCLPRTAEGCGKALCFALLAVFSLLLLMIRQGMGRVEFIAMTSGALALAVYSCCLILRLRRIRVETALERYKKTVADHGGDVQWLRRELEHQSGQCVCGGASCCRVGILAAALRNASMVKHGRRQHGATFPSGKDTRDREKKFARQPVAKPMQGNAVGES